MGLSSRHLLKSRKRLVAVDTYGVSVTRSPSHAGSWRRRAERPQAALLAS
jgi:hypothetical protein